MTTFAQREKFLEVEVEGVDDFRRALARAEKELRRRFDQNIRKAAAGVRDDARSRYWGFYERRTGRSDKGITSTVSFGQATIHLNKTGRRPWLMGQEWGSDDKPQFPAWGREGRFFWPAYTEGVDEVEQATIEAMDDAVKVLRGP